MRYGLVVSVLLLTGLTPAYGDVDVFSFSGVWTAGNVTSLGLLSAGDSFSGSLTFDTAGANACPGNSTYSLCINLSSLTLNLPAGSGLSVTSLPDPKLNFAGALYVGNPPTFLNFQVNDRSTVDGIFYIFGFYVGSGGAFGGAYVADQDFTHYLATTSYSSRGPTPVPEPASWLLLAAPALAFAALRRRRSRS